MLRRIALVMMLMASTVVVGLGGVAQAAPGGCTTGSAYADRLYGGYSSCAFGTGQHRIQIACSSYTGGHYYKFGVYQNVGARSYVFCNHPSERVLARYLDTR